MSKKLLSDPNFAIQTKIMAKNGNLFMDFWPIFDIFHRLRPYFCSKRDVWTDTPLIVHMNDLAKMAMWYPFLVLDLFRWISSPWPLMVAKIGKFCDYIVGRAQGTRIGEKHIESNTNPIFLLCFIYKQCKTLLCVSTANIELVSFCACRWCFWWCWWGRCGL